MQGRPVLAHARPWTVGVLADADGARRREVFGLGKLGLVLLGPRARRSTAKLGLEEEKGASRFAGVRRAHGEADGDAVCTADGLDSCFDAGPTPMEERCRDVWVWAGLHG